MGTPKRLYWDIETSPNIGMFWTAGWKLNIDYSNIIKERAIICICYKWEGQRKVHSLNWDGKQCDKKMLIEFVRVAKEADELVGHNGDKFLAPPAHDKVALAQARCDVGNQVFKHNIARRMAEQVVD